MLKWKAATPIGWSLTLATSSSTCSCPRPDDSMTWKCSGLAWTWTSGWRYRPRRRHRPPRSSLELPKGATMEPCPRPRTLPALLAQARTGRTRDPANLAPRTLAFTRARVCTDHGAFIIQSWLGCVRPPLGVCEIQRHVANKLLRRGVLAAQLEHLQNDLRGCVAREFSPFRPPRTHTSAHACSQ